MSPAPANRATLPPHATPRRARWAAIAGAAFVVAAAALASASLVRIVRTEPGLPLWDEAAQGFAGLEAARALGAGRVLEFLAVLNRQVVWPFVHALLMLPGFALLGAGYDTPALVNAALFGLTAALVFAAGLALHPARGPWIGTLAALLLLASPLYRVFGTLGMIEIPGACLLALGLALHARCSASDAPRGLLIAAGVSTAALFLLKYNYGLLWLAALLVNEWLRMDRAEREARRKRAVEWLHSGGLMRPWPLFLTIYLLALAAIHVTGGFEFGAFSRRVSVHSAGNPAYALLVILAVAGAIALARDPSAWRARWRSFPERRRVWIATVGAPLLAWFLIPVPNRVRALADFVSNRQSGPSPWSLDGLLYYPRAFATDYSPAPAIGWLGLALALVPPRLTASRAGDAGTRAPTEAADHRARLAGSAARLAYIALVIGLAATIAHRYHHPRFLFTTALLVWLNAARSAADLLGPLAARIPRPVCMTTAVAVLALGLVALPPPQEARVREAHRTWRTSESLEPVMDLVLDRAARESGRSVLLGYSYALSPGLISWRAAVKRPGLPLERLPKRAPWLEANAPEPAIAARLDRMLAPGTLVLAALPTRASPAWEQGYAAEVWADSVSAERLAADARVRSEGVGAAEGFRLLAFRVTTGAPAAR